ncbi:hypothetical protein B4086_5761 [Bacillus cereus]|nr:hypothetical protein B4086_5761 [Bacillus cereus]
MVIQTINSAIMSIAILAIYMTIAMTCKSAVAPFLPFRVYRVAKETKAQRLVVTMYAIVGLISINLFIMYG